jgi:hypothetical protein
MQVLLHVSTDDWRARRANNQRRALDSAWFSAGTRIGASVRASAGRCCGAPNAREGSGADVLHRKPNREERRNGAPPSSLPRRPAGGDRMSWVRTWLPAAIIIVGFVAAVASGFSETGAEGGGLLVAAGLSVWLINALYRFGVRGDRERDDEDRARTFFDEHGYWPDDDPPPPHPTGPSSTASP